MKKIIIVFVIMIICLLGYEGFTVHRDQLLVFAAGKENALIMYSRSGLLGKIHIYKYVSEILLRQVPTDSELFNAVANAPYVKYLGSTAGKNLDISKYHNNVLDMKQRGIIIRDDLKW